MNIALLLSGGTGTRLGADIPKQYLGVSGKPVISYSLERLSCHSKIDTIWIVAEAMWQKQIMKWLPEYDPRHKCRGFSLPGANRQLSILHGLEDMKAYAGESDYVLIHDAARPLLSEELITNCLEALHGHDGVLPVLPMKDTIYASRDGKMITSLLDRSCLFAGQRSEERRVGKECM